LFFTLFFVILQSEDCEDWLHLGIRASSSALGLHNLCRLKTANIKALAYLRDYCLRHGRAMHFSHGDIFEAEGAAARRFGYIESGSFHYLVRNYEGDESTVETVAAGDLVGCYPYCLDGDAAPVTKGYG